MDAGEPTPEEIEDLRKHALLEALSGMEEFQFFKEALQETLVDAYHALAGASRESDLWRAQGEVGMARKLLEMLEEAPLNRTKLQMMLRRRSQEQAAAEMAALDLEGQQRVDHYRRTRRPV